MLDTGVHATAGDLARAKGVAPSYVSRILRLTLLAPEIVEAILDGRQRAELQLDNLLEGFPATDADLLREMIGFAAKRLMEFEVGGLTGAGWGRKGPTGWSSATATATGLGDAGGCREPERGAAPRWCRPGCVLPEVRGPSPMSGQIIRPEPVSQRLPSPSQGIIVR